MTITDLCNRALGMLGDSSIQSLEDDTVASRACKRNIPIAIRFVGSIYDWQSMRGVAVLNKLSEPNPFDEEGFVYQLPPDNIKIIEIINAHDDATQNNYRVFGHKLYSTLDTVNVEYIQNTQLPGYWSPPLFECMAAYLSHLIARSVNTSEDKAVPTMQVFEKAKIEAIYHEESESSATTDYLHPGINDANRNPNPRYLV